MQSFQNSLTSSKHTPQSTKSYTYQPISIGTYDHLKKYRILKQNDGLEGLLAEQCMCRLYTSKTRYCSCQTHNDQCTMVLKWLALQYKQSEGPRLKSLYNGYCRNNKIDMHILQLDIKRDVEEIAQLWNCSKMSEQVKSVLSCFSKHCIYYRRPAYIKLYAWLCTALIYHCQEYQAFWLLDSITQDLDFLNKYQENIEQCYNLSKAYFRTKIEQMQADGLEMRDVVGYLLSDLLMSYIPLGFAGFHIESLLKTNWEHTKRLLLSYIDKRLDAMEKINIEGKQLYYVNLLNNETQWPIIYFNMSSFIKIDLKP